MPRSLFLLQLNRLGKKQHTAHAQLFCGDGFSANDNVNLVSKNLKTSQHLICYIR
jgi:hypothetical protein